MLYIIFWSNYFSKFIYLNKGAICLENDIVKRVILEAEYMIDTGDTLREIAKVFNVSKSTVHKDLKDRLKVIDEGLYLSVQQILKYHMDIRHIKGGESTKKKYLNLSC